MTGCATSRSRTRRTDDDRAARNSALTEPTSHVSLTAQPFFAHFGFEIVEHRVFDVRGVEMRNAAMRKLLRELAT